MITYGDYAVCWTCTLCCNHGNGNIEAYAFFWSSWMGGGGGGRGSVRRLRPVVDTHWVTTKIIELCIIFDKSLLFYNNKIYLFRFRSYYTLWMNLYFYISYWRYLIMISFITFARNVTSSYFIGNCAYSLCHCNVTYSKILNTRSFIFRCQKNAIKHNIFIVKIYTEHFIFPISLSEERK